MAHSSGVAGAEAVAGSFERAGVRYRVSREKGRVWLDWEGHRRELRYFIGSGAAARAYVLETAGFLFQAPATYYTARRMWNLPPSNESAVLTRPIVPGCLGCHASRLQPIAATLNA